MAIKDLIKSWGTSVGVARIRYWGTFEDGAPSSYCSWNDDYGCWEESDEHLKGRIKDHLKAKAGIATAGECMTPTAVIEIAGSSIAPPPSSLSYHSPGLFYQQLGRAMRLGPLGLDGTLNDAFHHQRRIDAVWAHEVRTGVVWAYITHNPESGVYE